MKTGGEGRAGEGRRGGEEGRGGERGCEVKTAGGFDSRKA